MEVIIAALITAIGGVVVAFIGRSTETKEVSHFISIKNEHKNEMNLKETENVRQSADSSSSTCWKMVFYGCLIILSALVALALINPSFGNPILLFMLFGIPTIVPIIFTFTEIKIGKVILSNFILATHTLISILLLLNDAQISFVSTLGISAYGLSIGLIFIIYPFRRRFKDALKSVI